MAIRKDEGLAEQVLGLGWQRWGGAEDTSARRVEAPVRRPGAGRWLRAVLNTYLSVFGVENL
jgi:hypothetical protein